MEQNNIKVEALLCLCIDFTLNDGKQSGMRFYILIYQKIRISSCILMTIVGELASFQYHSHIVCLARRSIIPYFLRHGRTIRGSQYANTP